MLKTIAGALALLGVAGSAVAATPLTPANNAALRNDSGPMTADQRQAIGERVRECWTKDVGSLVVDRDHILLTVLADSAGIARKVLVSSEDIGRMSDPQFRAFAERAIRAVMDVRCAKLPLPAAMLGKTAQLTFAFSP